MLKELIDGEAIVGAIIFDANGSPVVHHLPNTLTMKSIKNLTPILEIADRAKKINDELLGPLNYIALHFANFKVAFFNIGEKGTLVLFINPVWHIENLMTKIRQFINKVSRLL